MPQKKCINTFTTKTGKFTAHRAKATKCEAEALCRAKGQELASFTNEEDMQAAKDMFNNNNCYLDPNDPENYLYDVCDSQPELKSCPYSSADMDIQYNIGLNLEKQADGSFKKSFTNGMPWIEAEHSKLYFRNPEQKWRCPYGVFTPDYLDEKYIFGIGEKYDCDYEHRMSYVCLDPANRKPEGLVVPPTKNQESSFQVGTFMLAGICALVAFVTACVVAVFYRKKIGEMKEKIEASGNGA